MKAKIINGILEYYQQPSWLLGDSNSHAISEGYKEVVFQEGNGGVYESEGLIYVETPPESDWIHPDRNHRIKVPVMKLFSSPTWIALWGYCQAMEIPSYLVDNCRLIYLQDILPDHESFLISQGIEIETI